MLKELLSNQDNCVKITDLYLKLIGVNVTPESLEQQLSYHPDYPSLLSICDLFKSYGVNNLATRIDSASIDRVPTPFITQINSSEGYQIFTIVKKIENEKIEFYDFENLNWRQIERQKFEKKRKSKIVLITESDEAKDEKEYLLKAAERKIKILKNSAIISVIPVIVVCFLAINLYNYGSKVAEQASQTILYFFGGTLTSLLIWYEVDQHNRVLKQICSSGKKVNCSAILNSKASRLAGISWSVIGFTYFSGALLLLLFNGFFHSEVNYVLSTLNLLAIPYVIFSIFYQWRIAKQWCLICLGVQALLCLQAALGWSTTFDYQGLSTETILSVVFAFCLPYTISTFYIGTQKQAIENKTSKVELERLKHNELIFESLLVKQKTIEHSTDGLGIVLGNPNATQRIVKVCNPYCGPCAKAHLPLEELLESNSDLQIQIIFTASPHKTDRSYAPVSHLLALAENGDQTEIKEALDAWYLPEKKNYEVFARKFPMTNELDMQNAKIDAMSKWCEETDIQFTPTFFLNGRQLPSIYSVADLKYFLTAETA
jgi:uncharacterized membrane protein